MDTLQDVFKGSSKEINFIQYAVFMPAQNNEEKMIDTLKDTLDIIYSTIQPLLSQYIWQKDRFHLSIMYDDTQDPPYPFLFGASRFGDCINDEWFIVYILSLISNTLPDAVISLYDNDGDILLIESALNLPDWLDPSNSQNRVYLYQGQVHIIPLPSSPADILRIPSTGTLNRKNAIDIIRDSTKTTVASASIQQSILDRIQEYPVAAKHEIHHTTCLLPNKAAYVLLSEPQLITLAVEAFYLRDPISLKACASMSTFHPGDGMSETVISFTRTTYAQTVNQQFYAPKPFRLPSVSQRRKYKHAELGMKVACGLEMLYFNSNHAHSVDGFHYEKDKKYQDYIKYLKKIGYFKSEREGSAQYKYLMKQAEQQYMEYRKSDQITKKSISLDDLDADDEELFIGGEVFRETGKGVRQLIDDLLAEYSEDRLKALLQSVNPVEDKEDWMHVDPRQLEELLMKRMGHFKDNVMSDLERELDLDKENKMDVNIENMVSQLENFVENRQSGIDGVEFPNTRMDSEDSGEDDSEGDDDDKKIEFDIDKFLNILKGTSVDDTDDEDDMEAMMHEMDEEINTHDKLSKSFVKVNENTNEDSYEDEDAPVDIQLNLVKNVLESFKGQQGLPGPAGNLLNQFGFILPEDNEEDD
ncbi:SGT1 protein-domain-containing protein [Pilobolus umbonatus]|nr:SGT1 protein-domain-containing protein [Pilobolus umbonatus]